MTEPEFEARCAKLTEEARAAWGDLYHAASLREHYPAFRNAYEADLFEGCLADRVTFLCDDLHETIKEEFGYSWTFYQYGRSGATILPRELMRCVGGSGVGPLREDVPSFGLYLEDMEAEIAAAERLVGALRRVYAIISGEVACTAEWWADMKKANGWARQIRAHDGKTKRMVEVWR